MDANPHGDAGPITGIHTEPDRTSITAIFSLICSLVCCLPLVPLLGVALGALALVGIGRSKGRVGGKGFAVGGIVLGIFCTLLQGGAYALLDAGLGFMVREGNVVGQALTDLEGGDTDAMRSILAGPLGAMTDEELAEFRDAYTADMGSLVSTPQTSWELMRGYIENDPLTKPYQSRPGVMPITATFSGGTGVIVVITDPSGRTPNAGGTRVPVVDLLLVSPSGTEHALSAFDGPGVFTPEGGETGETPADEGP
ncbi:MAG: DUF4190 domain-containing protein [Phycisphaerales bacterium]